MFPLTPSGYSEFHSHSPHLSVSDVASKIDRIVKGDSVDVKNHIFNFCELFRESIPQEQRQYMFDHSMEYLQYSQGLLQTEETYENVFVKHLSTHPELGAIYDSFKSSFPHNQEKILRNRIIREYLQDECISLMENNPRMLYEDYIHFDLLSMDQLSVIQQKKTLKGASKITALEGLNYTLDTLDDDAFIFLLSSFQNLKKLSLAYPFISNMDWTRWELFSKKLKCISSLSLPISGEEPEILHKQLLLLSTWTQLREIHITDSDLSGISIDILQKMLPVLSGLRVLRLIRNDYTGWTSEMYECFFSSMHALKSLHIVGIFELEQLSPAHIKSIFSNLSNLETLVLNGGSFGGSKELTKKILSYLPKIQYLSLSSIHEFGTYSLKELIEIFSVLPPKTKLYIRWCYIDNETLEGLKEYFSQIEFV